VRWVRLTYGERAHAVLHASPDRTICGMQADGAREVHNPLHEDRCENCDKEWRRRGREARTARAPKRKYKQGTTYVPRHKWKDWE
jgi:hypothetical protein